MGGGGGTEGGWGENPQGLLKPSMEELHVPLSMSKFRSLTEDWSLLLYVDYHLPPKTAF